MQLWAVGNAVTLIDISDGALSRSKEIAEVLFPLAQEIVAIKCDLRDLKAVGEIRFPYRELQSSRLHLLSNVIDLLDAPAGFSRVARRISAFRSAQEKEDFNEIFVAMAPGDASGKVRRNMSRFQDEWKDVARQAQVVENRPFGCEFVFFEANTLRAAVVYSAYLDNPVVAETFRVLKGVECVDSRALVSALLSYAIDAGHFFDTYKHVRLMRSASKGHYLMFAPDVGDAHKICFLVLGDIEVVGRHDILRRWVKECVGCVEDSQIVECAKGFDIPRVKGSVESTRFWRRVWSFDFAVFIGWNECDGGSSLGIQLSEKDLRFGVNWSRRTPIDVSGLFQTDVRGVDELQEPKYNQKEIVYGRKQLRMVRGGPGTGKTFSMLLRALKVLEWRHMPVLVLCKTNSLVGMNRKRLIASFRKDFPCGDEVESRIQVMTVARYLCSVISNRDGCWGERGQDGYVRNRNCDLCMQNRIQEILSGKYDINAHSPMIAYGAVLVDEAQVMSTDELQAVYLLTGRGNPWRDFYVFCDEEQSFRENVLVDDSETKRKVVRAPSVGFGRYVTLKKNHRTYHPRLISLYKAFQTVMGDKYDVENLLMEELPVAEQKKFALDRPFMVSRSQGTYYGTMDVGFSDLRKTVEDALNDIGSKTLVVICDNVGLLRQWYNHAVKQEWIVTHLSDDTQREAQRRLRMSFKECSGKVHLTSVDCAEGQTFTNVLYIATKDVGDIGNWGVELTFTAVTRAREHLRVLDRSPSGWLYEMLKKFNED